jgi:alpha-tubulin suppressor-like RCC1 family protein
MWKRIDAGYSYTCGLRSDDTLWCWGFNDEGQVGYDSSGARVLSPHQVKLPAVQKQTWKSFSLGFYHACGLRWNSTLWCWGWNNGLQRADADQNLTPAPTMIPGPEGTWTGVTAGGSHTCAFLYNHQASCWGSNGYGQLGVSSVSGATADLLQIDSPFDGPAGTVVAGDEHSCGLTSDRFLWCWGRNQMGQLGIATNAGDPTTPQKSPAKVGTAKWLQLSAAEESTCGIQLNRTIWCWGNNVDGRLSGTVGTGSDGPNWAPRKVPSP